MKTSFTQPIKPMALLLSLLLVSACNNSLSSTVAKNPVVEAVSPVLINSVIELLLANPWLLKQATDSSGQRIAALFADETRPLGLEFKDGYLQISNTCNHLGGKYLLDMANNTLNLGELAGTMMACPQPLMDLDAAIAKRLEGPLQIAIEGKELRIQNQAGDVLVFGE